MLIGCICTSVTLGGFTYNVKEVYYDFQLNLVSQSVLIEGEIVASNMSYVEVQNTLPLQPHVGGIGSVSLKNTSSAKLVDGQIGSISMYNTSTLDIFGGEILTSLYVGTVGGTINVSDGYISNFRVSGSCLATLTGGQIDNLVVLNILPGLSINFVCDLDSLNLTYDGSGNLIHAEGNWMNGLGFDTNINVGIHDEYIHFIPEPATLLLLAIGGLLIRRK
jgi:hypothetical protein